MNRIDRLIGWRGESFGGLNQRRDSRRIVHGAVVDGIPADRPPNAEMIKMRGKNDVFVFETWVMTRQKSDNVGRMNSG